MATKTATRESEDLWKRIRKWPGEKKRDLARKLLTDKSLLPLPEDFLDFLDRVRISESRREKGRDVPLEEYVTRRNGR